MAFRAWGSTLQRNSSSLCLYGSQRVTLGRPRTTFVDGLSSLGLDIIMTLDQRHTSSWDWTNLLGQ